MKKISLITLAYFLLILVLATGIWRSYYRILYINIICHEVKIGNYNSFHILYSILISAALISFVAFTNFRKVSWQEHNKEKITALFPLLLFGLEAIFPVNFFTPVVFCIIIGLVIYRLTLSYDLNLTNEEKTKKWKIICPLTVTIIFVVFTSYGLYIQHVAWRSFYFTWTDWGILMEMVKHALDFRFGYSAYYGFNHLGYHFSPALIVLLPTMFFKDVNVFFLVSSIFLYGGGVIIYIYARSQKLSRSLSLLLSLIYFFTPGITNSNLSVYYGFRENFMAFIPIIAAAYFWDKKKYIPLVCLIIFSMMIKETVLIFLACLGAVLIIRKKYRDGIVLFISSSLLFLIVFFVFFPWMQDGQEYSQLYRYSGLGNGLSDILMSSINKPVLFWGRFIRPSVVCYIATLLVPFFILIGIRPLVCLSGAIILFFTCLQSDEWFINIKAWCQTLPLIGIYLCILWNCRDINQDKRNNRWLGWLQYGIAKKNNSKLLSAAVVSCTACVILGWFFWAQSPLGKVFYPDLKGDYRQMMSKMNQLIPAEAKITVTGNPSTHMFFRNLSFDLNKEKLGDYVIFDLLNTRANAQNKNLNLRDTLLKSKDFFPVAIEKKPHSMLMLFSRDPSAKRMPCPKLFTKAEVKWDNQKLALPVSDKNFDLRLRFVKYKKRVRVDFFIKLKKKIDYDTKFTINLSNGKNNRFWSFFAGDGLLPTWSWSKKQIYCFSSLLPQNFVPRKGYCSMQKLKTTYNVKAKHHLPNEL